MNSVLELSSHGKRLLIICGAIVLNVSPALAESERVVQVEEHWELTLGHPDQERSAPQTTMVISPSDNLEGIHFFFTLNHANVPSYEPGGMQIQAWDGQVLQESHLGNKLGTHAYANEVVRWVQRMTIADGNLEFRIAEGESETWGSFGGDDLAIQVPTELSSLNGYRPGVGLTESQVSYAENRVESLILTKLVWVTEDGTVHEMNAPIAIDTSLDQ
jgi:hypothetical protein